MDYLKHTFKGPFSQTVIVITLEIESEFHKEKNIFSLSTAFGEHFSTVVCIFFLRYSP